MGDAHSPSVLKQFDSTKLGRLCHWQTESSGIDIQFVCSQCGLMVPADLTFAAGNTEQWPFDQRELGCFAEVATLQNLIQGSFSNSLDDTGKQCWFMYLHMKITLD